MTMLGGIPERMGLLALVIVMGRKSRTNSQQLASRLTQAGLHTGITLWHRLPMIGIPAHTGECNRMVSEKLSAYSEGLFAAHRLAIQLMVEATTGRMPFSDYPNAGAEIATAGLRPALRTVKANARRLSRR